MRSVDLDFHSATGLGREQVAERYFAPDRHSCESPYFVSGSLGQQTSANGMHGQ